MKISKARQSDLAEIQKMVQGCIIDMNAHGIKQWNDQYPPMEIFKSDIESGILYKLTFEHNIIGIIVLSPEQEEQYEDIDWTDVDGRYLVIHRLAIHPEYQRLGYGEKLLRFAEEFAAENGYTSIRIDTFSENPRTLKLFEKLNYRRKTGEIHFPENIEPYFCYEKIL